SNAWTVAGAFCFLEGLAEAGLLQNSICGEFRFQLAIHRDVDPSSRIPPDFVIAAPLPLELETIGSEKTNDLAIVVGHWQGYSAAVSRSLARAMISIDAGGSTMPSSSRRSRIIPGSFALSASIESASVTSPLMSWVVATQTPASGSQSA